MDSRVAPHSFPKLVQDFFSEYLIAQRGASRHTVAGYRDTFRLLFQYADRQLGKKPSDLLLTDLDASLILSFLSHLENGRKNSVATRNVRLAAIRSFLNYAGFMNPGSLALIQRARAIPAKRRDRVVVGFLSREEIQAILDAPDRTTWSGERDYAMWTTFYNTGARVSEITGLRLQDLDLDHRACLQVTGKGRKQRLVPLWRSTIKILTRWKGRLPCGLTTPLFPNREGQPMTRSGVENRLTVAVRKAIEWCPTLKGKSVTPHTLRHTTAMHLLQSGVDITVIALWLGHESIETTHYYVEADLEMKRKALESLSETPFLGRAYRPTDRLLVFLESL